MRRLLEIIWNGHTGRRLRVVVAGGTGQVGARLQDVGADGWLEIAANASLVFGPNPPRAPDEGLGIRQSMNELGVSTVIAAADVSTLNMHFGRAPRRPNGIPVRACVFEVTLTGDDNTARFALFPRNYDGISSYAHPSADVSYFARQLRRKRAELGLSEIELTTTTAEDYF